MIDDQIPLNICIISDFGMVHNYDNTPELRGRNNHNTNIEYVVQLPATQMTFQFFYYTKYLSVYIQHKVIQQW